MKKQVKAVQTKLAPEKKVGVLVKSDLQPFLRILLFALVTLLIVFSVFAVNLFFSSSNNIALLVIIIVVIIIPLLAMTFFVLKFLSNYIGSKNNKVKSGVIINK